MEIRKAAIADITALVENIRQEDRIELEALSAKSIYEQILESFEQSTVCLTAFNSGNVVAMYGFAAPVIWCISAGEAENCKISFLKESKRFVAYCLTKSPVICNITDARYIRSLKWIKHLGAKIFKDYEINGITFKAWKIVR